LAWITKYLEDLGGGGVLAFRTRRQLERAFPPDSELSQTEVRSGSDALETGEDLRLKPTPELLRQAIVLGLRVLDAPSGEPIVDWRTSRAFLTLFDVDNDDVFDTERREVWCEVCQLRISPRYPTCPNDPAHDLVERLARLG
jgi:hypothetical protein